jgi:hypothetical protein
MADPAAAEREVVGLVFHRGWPRARLADGFSVDVRTIRRWFDASLTKLQWTLKDDPPR